MKKESLLVYTGRQKTPMSFMANKDLFLYPFTQMISRTAFNISFFNFSKGAETIKELTNIPSRNFSFEECCMDRAKTLLNLNKDFYYILYSGGIDSTGLIVSLLQSWNSDQLKKITIVLTSHSILENPHFFNNIIKKFKIYNYMNGIQKILNCNRSIVITGELGDQLFGSGMLLFSYYKIGPQILKAPFRDNGGQVIEEYLLSDTKKGIGNGKKMFDHIVNISDECPFPIKSNFDFFWWFNFSQEWQFAKYKFYESFDCPISARYGENIIHFYDSIEFQQWSLQNHDLKIKDNWDSYKFTNKEFIYKYTKQPFNLRQQKLQSLKNTYFFQTFRAGMTSEYIPISNHNDLEPYVK